MKVCYVDESGNTAQDPCLVMVGIVVDAARLHRTREEFSEVFDIVQGLFTENLKELKGAKMILGRDRWRKIDPSVRKTISTFFCKWVVRRKHHIALSAIDRERFIQNDSCGLSPTFSDPWLMSSLHIALQLQKHHQAKASNKGQTFLFMDENKIGIDQLTEILFSPPKWTDDYYQKDSSQPPLNQLVDSAFAVKSHHAGLVQVADLYAFILRRYAELCDYGSSEQWSGERAMIDGYVRILVSRLLPQSTRWPPRPKSACGKWFNEIAPPSLRILGN